MSWKTTIIMTLIAAVGATGLVLWNNHGKRSVGVQMSETSRARTVRAAPAPQAGLKKAPPSDSIPPSTLEDQWGLRFSSVALTNQGATVELLYVVIDPNKAAALGQDAQANLVDLGSGRMLQLGTPPQTTAGLSAHSRARSMAMAMSGTGGFPPPASRLIAGKTYSVLVQNTGGVFQRGGRAVVIIGAPECSTDVFTLN